MEERVTINDIARESGVSPSTVSLVLNNKPGVAQETRARVWAVAESRGYALRPAPPLERATRLSAVGVAVKQESDTSPFANPFYSRVLAGIDEACRVNGVKMLFAILPVDVDNRPIHPQPVFQDAQIDGMLMVGTFVDSTISALSIRKLPPVVLVDGYSDTESYDMVISDNFRAAYLAVEYLVEHGHRKIGLVGGEEISYPSIRDRRNGYFRALKDRGITESWCANFNINRTHGYQETLELLKANAQITALFAANDEAAVDAIRAAQDLGKRVPEDISVIGFDDSYLAVRSKPPLTTMRVDTTALGFAAIHLLDLRLQKPSLARMTLTVHLDRIDRESVCSPKS